MLTMSNNDHLCENKNKYPINAFVDADDSQDSETREGTIFIPHYQFHPITNIQTFATLLVK